MSSAASSDRPLISAPPSPAGLPSDDGFANAAAEQNESSLNTSTATTTTITATTTLAAAEQQQNAQARTSLSTLKPGRGGGVRPQTLNKESLNAAPFYPQQQQQQNANVNSNQQNGAAARNGPNVQSTNGTANEATTPKEVVATPPPKATEFVFVNETAKMYDIIRPPNRGGIPFPTSTDSFDFGVTKCKLRPCGHYIVWTPNMPDETCLIAHNLPPNATAATLGRLLEEVGGRVVEADIFYDDEYLCNGRGYALLDNPTLTAELLKQGGLYLASAKRFVYLLPCDWPPPGRKGQLPAQPPQHHIPQQHPTPPTAAGNVPDASFSLLPPPPTDAGSHQHFGLEHQHHHHHRHHNPQLAHNNHAEWRGGAQPRGGFRGGFAGRGFGQVDRGIRGGGIVAGGRGGYRGDFDPRGGQPRGGLSRQFAFEAASHQHHHHQRHHHHHHNSHFKPAQFAHQNEHEEFHGNYSHQHGNEFEYNPEYNNSNNIANTGDGLHATAAAVAGGNYNQGHFSETHQHHHPVRGGRGAHFGFGHHSYHNGHHHHHQQHADPSTPSSSSAVSPNFLPNEEMNFGARGSRGVRGSRGRGL